MKEVPRDNKWDGTKEPDGEQVSDGTAPVESDDPFAPGNVEVVTAITLLRIYDVMLADFMARHPQAGGRLMEKHARGGFMAPPPAFNPNEVTSYEGDN